MKVKCIKDVKKETRYDSAVKDKIYFVENGYILGDNNKKVCHLNSSQGRRSFKGVKEMTKDDLKTGMVVELRDETVLMVLIDKAINNDDHIEFKNFKDDLKHKKYQNLDVVKVYDIPKGLNRFKYLPDGCDLIWERQEKSAAELELESIQAEMNKLTERMEQLKKEV